MDDKIAAASSSSRQISDNEHYNGQLNDNLGNVFALQVRYQAAIALINTPGITVGGILIEWIPFITQFKHNFKSVIKDNSSLFTILLHYLRGDALESVRSCIFNVEGKNQIRTSFEHT